MANERKTQAYIDVLKVHPEWAIGDAEQQDADAIDIARYGKPTRFMLPAEIAALPHTFIEPVTGTPIAVSQIPAPAIVPQQVPMMPVQFPPVDRPTPVQPITTIQPATVQQLKPYDQWPDAADYKAFLDSIEALIGTIGTSIQDQINVKLEAPTKTIGTIKDLQIGHIQKKLDDCGKKLAKAQEKALKPINQQMAQCYGYLMPCGFPYPTQEQVVYGLQSGNYMQSVGIPYPPGTIVNQQQTNQPQPIGTYQQQPIQQTLINQQSQPQSVTNNETINNYETITTIEPTTITPTIGTIHSEQEPIRPTTVTNEYIGGTNSSSTTNTSTVEYYPLLGGEIPQAVPVNPHIPISVNPPLREGKSVGTPFSTPLWDNPNVCNELKLAAAKIGDSNPLGFYIEGGFRIAPRWWHQFWDWNNVGDEAGWSWLKRNSEQMLWSLIRGLSDDTKLIVKAMSEMGRCSSLPYDAVLVKFISGFVNHWTNDAFAGLFKGFDYKMNQACPQEIPSQAEVNKLYLSNLITENYWKCLTEANNNLPILQRQVVHADRKKLTFDDALKMYRLGWMDESEFFNFAHQDGVMSSADIEALMKNAVDIPTVSDLVRMMVRDVGDPEIVAAYGMDDQFEQKWSGELEKYAKAQGMSPEIAKLHWRAHWDHPSATQAFEMLHRLRPDSLWAQKLEKNLAVEAAIKGVKSPGIITTASDVQRLLEVNDLSWYWRERLGAISYNPLTRTDVLRAFMIDAIKEEDLLSAYQDAGYTAFDAATLVEFAKQQKKERNIRKQGSRDISKLKKFYVDGLMSLDELKAELKVRIPNEEKRANILQDATTDEFYTRRSKLMLCTKSEYKLGMLDDVQAKERLVKIGIPTEKAIEIVDECYCSHSKKAKTVSAAKLCEWRERNLITPEQHLQRLVNLGYKLTDAELIVSDCGISANEKTRRQIVAQIKAAAAQADKLAKNQAKAVKQAEVAANKEAKAEKNTL